MSSRDDETYRTRDAASSQPLGPRLLGTWTQVHFGLGSRLFIVVDPRGRWVSGDGIAGTGGGDTRRRGHAAGRVMLVG